MQKYGKSNTQNEIFLNIFLNSLCFRRIKNCFFQKKGRFPSAKPMFVQQLINQWIVLKYKIFSPFLVME